MERKPVSEIMLTLLLVSMLALAISISTAGYVLVPNGSFESGTVGLIPDSWVMIDWRVGHGPENSTRIREMEQTDQMYFEGSKSLWLHSRIVNTDGMKRSRSSQVWAETEDWINAPLATHVRIYIRGINSAHSPAGWGWSNYIRLNINNQSVARKLYDSEYKPWIFAHGEFVNWNLYNYTAVGADGASWYVYEYAIPESVDKTHMKIQIVSWAGDWSFYSTSYYSDLEFFVDKVELLLPAATATVDIKPDTLNLIGKGKWTTTYIELPEGYNVSDIDVSSISLNGTVPVDLDAPTDIGDYDEDDVSDLMVKFDRAAVTSYIQSVVGPQDRFGAVTLTITGFLNDGTPFLGSATIKTIYIDIETLAEKMLRYENYMQRV